MNGREYVAEMLIAMSRDDRDEILNAISDTDVELGEEIRKQMFTFDDLLNLDPRGMQRLGRDVDNANLMLALKTGERSDEGALVQLDVPRSADAARGS